MALKKRQISKDVRNKMINEYFKFLLNIIKDLSTRVNIGETKIYALSGLIDGTSEEAILKTKIKTLEEENEALKAKMLDLDNFKASSASVHNLQELKLAIIEELPKIMENERIEACNTLFNTLEKRNEGILAEVRKTKELSFAQAANNGKYLPQRNLPPTHNVTTLDPEGVVLIKPKEDDVRDFEENYRLFMGIIKNQIPEARIRGSGRIVGGGVRITCECTEEAVKLRERILASMANDVPNKFDFIVPRKRDPQLIIYNVEKEIEAETLLQGLLSKNDGLVETNKEGGSHD